MILCMLRLNAFAVLSIFERGFVLLEVFVDVYCVCEGVYKCWD